MLSSICVMANNQAEPASSFANIFSNTASDSSGSLHNECRNDSTIKKCGNDQAIDIENAQNIFNLRCSDCGCLIDYRGVINYIKNTVMSPRISFSVGTASHHELVLRLIERIITLQNSEDFFLFSLDCGFAEPNDFITKLVNYCKHYMEDSSSAEAAKSTKNKYGAVQELVNTLEKMALHRETVSSQTFKFNSFLKIDMKRAFLFYRINRSVFSDAMSSSIDHSDATQLLMDMGILIENHREPIARDFVYAKLILLLGNALTDIKSTSLCQQALLQAVNSVGETVKKSTSYICRLIPSIGNSQIQRLKISNFILDDSSLDDDNNIIDYVCREYLHANKKQQVFKIKELIGEVSAILDAGKAAMSTDRIDLIVKKFNHAVLVFSKLYAKYCPEAGPAKAGSGNDVFITDLANLVELASNSKYLAYSIGALETSLAAIFRDKPLAYNVLSVPRKNLFDRGKIYSIIFHNSQPISAGDDTTQSSVDAAQSMALSAHKVFDRIFYTINNPTSRVVIAFELFNTRVIVPEFHDLFVGKILEKMGQLEQQARGNLATKDKQRDNPPYIHYMLGCLIYVTMLIESHQPSSAYGDTIIQYLTVYRDCFTKFHSEILKIVRIPFDDNLVTHFLYALNYHLKLLVLDRQIPFDLSVCEFPLDILLTNIGLRIGSVGRLMNGTTNRWVKELATKVTKSVIRYVINFGSNILARISNLDVYGSMEGHTYITIMMNNAIKALLNDGIKPTEIYADAILPDDIGASLLFAAYFLQMILDRFPDKRIMGLHEIINNFYKISAQRRSKEVEDAKGAILWALHDTLDRFRATLIGRLGGCQTPEAVIALTIEFTEMFRDATFYVDFNRLGPEVRGKITDMLRAITAQYLAVTGRLAGGSASTYQCLEALEEIYPTNPSPITLRI